MLPISILSKIDTKKLLPNIYNLDKQTVNQLIFMKIYL